MLSDGDLQTIDKQVQEVCDWLDIATKPDEQHTVETISHKLSDCKTCLSKLQEDFSSKDKLVSYLFTHIQSKYYLTFSAVELVYVFIASPTKKL